MKDAHIPNHPYPDGWQLDQEECCYSPIRMKYDEIEYGQITDLIDLDRIQWYVELEENHPCKK